MTRKDGKGPRKAILEFFLQIRDRGTRHVPTYQAQVGPTPRGTEIKNVIFIIVRTVPFEGVNSDSCSDQVLGVYDSHF